jgi:hypothetical protein
MRAIMVKLKDMKLSTKFPGFLDEVLGIAYMKYKMTSMQDFQNEILVILKTIHDCETWIDDVANQKENGQLTTFERNNGLDRN